MNKVIVRIEKDYLTWVATSDDRNYNPPGESITTPIHCIRSVIGTAHWHQDTLEISCEWQYASEVLSCIIDILQDNKQYSSVSFHVHGK